MHGSPWSALSSIYTAVHRSVFPIVARTADTVVSLKIWTSQFNAQIAHNTLFIAQANLQINKILKSDKKNKKNKGKLYRQEEYIGPGDIRLQSVEYSGYVYGGVSPQEEPLQKKKWY